jgi:hypothetical protein
MRFQAFVAGPLHTRSDTRRHTHRLTWITCDSSRNSRPLLPVCRCDADESSVAQCSVLRPTHTSAGGAPKMVFGRWWKAGVSAARCEHALAARTLAREGSRLCDRKGLHERKIEAQAMQGTQFVHMRHGQCARSGCSAGLQHSASLSSVHGGAGMEKAVVRPPLSLLTLWDARRLGRSSSSSSSSVKQRWTCPFRPPPSLSRWWLSDLPLTSLPSSTTVQVLSAAAPPLQPVAVLKGAQPRRVCLS